jgi:hypothetical protein
MNIRFKLPAIAIDDKGHEQEIELTFEASSESFSISDGMVKGDIASSDFYVSFKFNQKRPFRVKESSIDWR